MIKQLSMFLRNQPGELSKIMSVFDEYKIKIIAMCITDTNENGIFRVIVDKPVAAEMILKKIGINNFTSSVLIVKITEIKKLFFEMNANNLNVEYMYSMDSNYLVIKFDNLEEGYDILFKLGYKFLDENEILMEDSNENRMER